LNESPVLKSDISSVIKYFDIVVWQLYLKNLDALARELNVSRQAVIKINLRQALEQHRLARQTTIQTYQL
jgi:hypothetical protein